MAGSHEALVQQEISPVTYSVLHRRACLLALLCALIALPCASGIAQKSETSDAGRDYLRVHRDAIVVDGHNDVLMRVMAGDRIDARSGKGHSDLDRFLLSGQDAQVFSVWVPEKYGETAAASKYANTEIDSLLAILGRNPGKATLVRNAEEFGKAVREGRLAAIIGMEGAHPLCASRQNLIACYRRGLRSLGLTWNNSTSWASSARDESEGKGNPGLTRAGKSMIALLDSLGVLIDISHLGARAVADVLATTRNPVIASHSACAALRQHYRNLTDDQLRAIAKNGGVVMVNYFPVFIKPGVTSKTLDQSERYRKQLLALRNSRNEYTRSGLKKRAALIAEARKHGLATIDDVVAHIEHIIAVAGIEHVGLGSDFDGIDFAPVGLGDVTDLPMLTRALMDAGHSADDVRKILGGNFLRVFSAVCK